MVKRICVIGAGAAGLPSIKCCLQDGFDVVCYEKSDDIGGVWRFREESQPGISGTQRTTVQNTSKEMNSYSDFPVPKEFPCDLYHAQLMEYFRMYCDNLKLWDKIKFQHEVVEVKPNYDYDLTGKWIVSVINCKISERSESVFDGVMVCIGHHFTPRMPTFKDQNIFKGISFKFNIL